LIFNVVKGEIATYNGGGDFFAVGARFDFSSRASDFLFKRVPSVIKIPHASDQASAMRWGLEQFASEFRSRKQGRQLVLEHLLHFVLVQSLRAYMESTPSISGWLGALADKNLSKAIELIQEDLQRNWTVEDLADAVGMSRSTFALRFKECLGLSPISYSRNWKMLVAQERLTNSDDSIAAIAHSLGYESESSFRLAFKRVTSSPPGRFRKQ
jgi:AraC-like DNA-binding protein